MYQIITGLLFYFFSLITITSAIMVIFMRNPVHAVMSLIVGFFSTAGLFILIGAEFLAMTLIIVYVGAVAVLFLFVIMMLNVDIVELRKGILKYLPIALLVSIILFYDLYLIIINSIGKIKGAAQPALPIPDPIEITNTHAIGQVLYTNYFYPFQTAGIILFVAMISCIVLTLRLRVSVRKQNIGEQLSRTRQQSIRLVEIKADINIENDRDKDV